MSFGPRKIEFKDAIINSFGSLIAWFIGSVVMLLIVFFTSGFLDVPAWFSQVETWVKTSSIFPIFLSIVTLIGTSAAMFSTYKFFNLTDSEKYKSNLIILGQIAFFIVFVYVFITPIYIFEWLKTYENIMYIYLIHTLLLVFGTSIIIEILNNYRYVLLGLFGSFVWLFFASIFTLWIYNSFSTSYAKLISLLVILPVANFLMTLFKQLFELLYFYYNKYTNLDPLWDIFYQIELEEREKLREEEEENSL